MDSQTGQHLVLVKRLLKAVAPSSIIVISGGRIGKDGNSGNYDDLFCRVLVSEVKIGKAEFDESSTVNGVSVPFTKTWNPPFIMAVGMEWKLCRSLLRAPLEFILAS